MFCSKLSFMNIWGLRWNFGECESFLESNSRDILALCETNLDDSFDSGNFSLKGYVPWIWKDSITYMHGLAIHVKEELPFPWDLSLENSCLYFQLVLLHSASDFCFLYQLPSCLWMVFDSISSIIDEVLLINPFANVFVFRDFNVHHKDWLIYSGGTNRPSELCYNLKSPYTDGWLSYSDLWLWLLQSYSCGFIFFFWCWYLFYNDFSSIEKFWSCCLSFHLLSVKMCCPVSSRSLWLLSCYLGCSLWSFERCEDGFFFFLIYILDTTHLQQYYNKTN